MLGQYINITKINFEKHLKLTPMLPRFLENWGSIFTTKGFTDLDNAFLMHPFKDLFGTRPITETELFDVNFILRCSIYRV